MLKLFACMDEGVRKERELLPESEGQEGSPKKETHAE